MPIAGTHPRGKTEEEDRRLDEELLNNPKELADYILDRVRQYKNGRFLDDMTVLVMGIWKR